MEVSDDSEVNLSDSNKKLILLNVMNKSIIDKDKDLVKNVKDVLKVSNKSNSVVVIPIMTLSLIKEMIASGAWVDLPDYWQTAIKRVDVSQSNSEEFFKSVNNCIQNTPAKIFHVETDNSKQSFGISLEDKQIIKFLASNQLVPLFTFYVDSLEEASRLGPVINQIFSILKVEDQKYHNAIISISMIGDLLISSEGAMGQLLSFFDDKFKKEGVSRDSIKLVVGGTLVDYMAISDEEIAEVDGLLLSSYDGDETIICNKISKLIERI